MYCIELEAYNFRLENQIFNLPINFHILKKYCIDCGYIIKTYKEAEPYIAGTFLEECAKHNRAFTCIGQESIIYMDGSLSIEEKIRVLAHEIGHIWLKHESGSGFLGVSNSASITAKQEEEAEAFSLFLRAPICILRKKGFSSIDEIRHHALISHLEAERVLGMIKNLDTISETEEKLIQKMCCPEQNPTPEVKKAKRKLLRKILFLIIAGLSVFIVCLLVFNRSEPGVRPNVTSPESIVYVTPSGEKYHISGCRYIKDKDTVEITIKDAETAGYGPCSVCLGP